MWYPKRKLHLKNHQFQVRAVSFKEDISRWYPPVVVVWNPTVTLSSFHPRNPKLDASEIDKTMPTCEKLCESNGDLCDSGVQVHHGYGVAIRVNGTLGGG